VIASKSFLRIVVVLVSSIGLACANDSSESWLAKFYTWSCKRINFGCERTTRSVIVPRSGELRPRGDALVLINLRSHATQTLLADCKCWSPVPLRSNAVAVVTAAGIVEVPLDPRSKSRLILPAEDVRELVGTELRADHNLLFLRTSHATGCEFEPWLLNPSTLATQAVPESELPCGSDLDFQSLVKPSQTLDGRSLLTVKYRGQFEIDLQSKDGIEPLFPERGASSHFDAVWINPRTIVFVTEH